MDFIRSNILKDHTAATEARTLDLPINPLSHILISLEVYNVTDEATLAEIIAFINSVSITWKGQTIYQLESEAISAQMAYLFASQVHLSNNVATDNASRNLGLIIPFGRSIFNPDECFPATLRGELQLTLDTTVPATSCDNGIINVETVELPGASPSRYLKSTMLSVTAPGATGENQIPLSIGNRYVALALQHTTFTLTGSHTYGIKSCKIKKNNKEWGYSLAKTQAMMIDRIFRVSSLPRDIAAFGQIIPDLYTWLDFDPVGNGEFLLESAGLSSLDLILDMGVDEACKIIKMELVDL
ncbi:MAG: hypothetical protein OEM02_12300 [Desulfobulbaceae bacterium]|nr:hypothetical protein [Desulfobulbaceae bacterium]